jgi:hypothetical protein
MMEVVENSGTRFMIPSQTSYFAGDHGSPKQESRIISPD